MTEQGYKAFRESAALLDLSGRGKLRASGEDRARLLHAMTTNHIQEMQPGQGRYVFFLNAQGRIQCDANMLAMADHFLIDTEPETHEKLYKHLDSYIIADDVVLEDLTAATATLSIEGPHAERILSAIGAPVPGEPMASVAWSAKLAARLNSTGMPGYFLMVPAEEKDALIGELVKAGAVPADSDDARIVRIENGKPRYGEDILETVIPQETQVMYSVHFNKGCYLGQEIVERVRSRGRLNRMLVSLDIETQTPPPADTKVTVDEKEAGRITSAVFSPNRGKVVAFAYLRAERVEATNLMVEGAPAGGVRRPLNQPEI